MLSIIVIDDDHGRVIRRALIRKGRVIEKSIEKFRPEFFLSYVFLSTRTEIGQAYSS